MRTDLTTRHGIRTMPLAGETDAGSAGEQPARDTRPGRRNTVGVEKPSTLLFPMVFQNPLCLKKLPAEGRFYHLTVKGVCPFHAEPVQYHVNTFCKCPPEKHSEHVFSYSRVRSAEGDGCDCEGIYLPGRKDISSLAGVSHGGNKDLVTVYSLSTGYS
jgi:hypothetical protein